MKKFSFFKFSETNKDNPQQVEVEPKKKKVKEKIVKPPRIPSEFEKYYFYRFADRKEYKQRRARFAKEIVPILIDGCGGIKNIFGVKLINYVVEIRFGNLYQLKKDVLEKTGGLWLKIGDHKLTYIFDTLEAKIIVSMIRKEIKANKGKFIKLDIA